MPEHDEHLHARYFGEHHVTIIEPARVLGWIDLREIWAYRNLFFELSMRHLRVRYKQTLLGVAWVVVQPVFQMLIFSAIFSRIASMPSEGLPYPVFVYAGLLAWNFFSTATSSAAMSLVVNSCLITKVYFPRMIIPLSCVLASLVDFCVSACVLCSLLIAYHVQPSASLLALPCLVLCLTLSAAGIGSALGALNVAWRDLGHALPFLMQVWLYATPVLYSRQAVPHGLGVLLALNPLSPMIDLFRSAVTGRAVEVGSLLMCLGFATTLFVAGAAIFHAVERRFADVV